MRIMFLSFHGRTCTLPEHIRSLSPGYLRCSQGLFEVWRSKIGIHSCTLYQLSLRVPACLFLQGSLVSESRSSLTCSSYHAKKVIPFGEFLRENILYPLPHRQYVFSIPIILRKYFLYNRKLLSRLCTCAGEPSNIPANRSQA